MPNNSHAVLPATVHFEGRVVDNSFTLEKFLDGTDHHGRFAAHISGAPAIAAIYPNQTSSQSEQLDVWNRVQALNHPSLLKILTTGTSEWPDLRFTYIATEAPTQVVAEVLEDRALDQGEAREVLDSLLRGLDALHAAGLVHGAVNPQNIVATESAVKLTVSPIRPAEGEGTAAFDIWSAGRTVFQLLTQRLPSNQHFFEVSTLPSPFSTLLLHCLEEDPAQRWTAADLLNLLTKNTAKDPVAEESSIEEIPEPAKQEPLVKPVEAKPSYVARPPETSEKKVDASRYVPKFVLLAVALFLVALTIFLLSRSRASHPATSQQPAQTAPPAVTPPLAAVRPDNPAPAVTSPATRQQANPVQSAGNWRVIAFTYNSVQAAQHKANSVNARDPGVDAQVFSPQQGRYLVALGGWMSREDAMRLRDKARSHGLAHDIYAQNFHK